jgi:hypothetical protein
MRIPPDFVRLIHVVLVGHYKRHYHDGDPEVFAVSFAENLLGPLTLAEASRAADHVDIKNLPYVAVGADENWRLAGVLRQVLARDVRKWLLESGIWQYSPDLKARAFAHALANSVDAGFYGQAIANAKHGSFLADPYEDMPERERAAIAAEERCNVGRGRW